MKFRVIKIKRELNCVFVNIERLLVSSSHQELPSKKIFLSDVKKEK